VTARDFEDYDLLFSMAQDVTEDLREMCPRSDLMRKVVPFLDVGDVPDPWYGSAAAFSECYDVVERASRDQLARLVRDSAASERL
jgi:protein-tyrosine-phosphatase